MIGYNEIAEISRYLDAQSEEGRPFEDTVGNRNIDAAGLVRAAEQRAMRIAMMIAGQDPRTLPRDRKSVVNLPPAVRDLMPSLQVAYMDGFIAGRAVSDPADRIQRFPEREDQDK